MSHLVKPPISLGFYFNGLDAHIDIPTPSYFLWGSTPKTVCLWLWTRAYNPDKVMMPFSTGVGQTRRDWSLFIRTDGSYQLNTWADDLRTSTKARLQEWDFVCMWYDGDVTIKLYVNGVQAGVKTLGGVLDTAQSIVRLGAYSRSLDYFYNGIVGECIAFNRALSETEMEEIRTLRRNIMDGCVLKLGKVGLVKGGGSKWLDESGYSYHGDVYGAVRVRCCHCNPVVLYGSATPI